MWFDMVWSGRFPLDQRVSVPCRCTPNLSRHLAVALVADLGCPTSWAAASRQYAGTSRPSHMRNAYCFAGPKQKRGGGGMETWSAWRRKSCCGEGGMVFSYGGQGHTSGHSLSQACTYSPLLLDYHHNVCLYELWSRYAGRATGALCIRLLLHCDVLHLPPATVPYLLNFLPTG